MILAIWTSLAVGRMWRSDSSILTHLLSSQKTILGGLRGFGALVDLGELGAQQRENKLVAARKCSNKFGIALGLH